MSFNKILDRNNIIRSIIENKDKEWFDRLGYSVDKGKHINLVLAI